MSSCFGTLFRISTFGESHGVAIGCSVDGCPAGIKLNSNIIQSFLNRRKPGQNEFTTSRNENDHCEIISGVENSVTLGSPIAVIVKNNNKIPNDYSEINKIFRPGHADYTTYKKYKVSPSSGGGRASARETIGRVAAAAIAKAYVNSILPDIEVIGWVDRIYNIKANVNENLITFEEVEASQIRCPDINAEILMKEKILKVKEDGDSLGGVVRCVARNIPCGLGEPVFDKLEADLAKAMLSLPAVKSFEIGNGLEATYLKGSENNDPYIIDTDKKVKTQSNNSGGIQGGISNGMPIVISVGFKAVSTIFKQQKTITKDFCETNFVVSNGRHDSCVLPRAVPLVEAMFWIVLADHLLRQIALNHNFIKEIKN